MQAFGRVFRIGQTKETHFLRIIAEDTIDNRIETIQENKAKNISAVVGPGKRKKLSTEELARLFDYLETDEDGGPEGVTDNEGRYASDGDGEVKEA
ncbi:putative DNA repair protein rad5 protein [Rosellinia necatrix]|uniref:Putative DNA repair protein rad5 protein n=1 Tax=Rosellinia necatrix TaxID=77044 RepID=A0A1S8A4Q6_ROSNE|nr:putative DNA repair protein rad5 protein [Rosellinia necatrix]